MRRGLDALARRPLVASLVASMYAIAAIVLHDPVNEAVRSIQQGLGRRTFTALAGALALLAAAAVVATIRRRPPGRRAPVVVAFLLWTFAVGVAWQFLFTVASEAIHFPQYAGLALLLFPLVGRPGAAMVVAGLVGLADEGYQYWVLHPKWGIYLDWNDITLNALGALLGGILLALVADGGTTRRRAAAAPYALAALLLVAGVFATRAGKIALHAGAGGERPEGIWLLLDRGDTAHQPFWITAEWAQKRFHVLGSEAGATLFALFVGIAAAVDLAASRRRRGKSS